MKEIILFLFYYFLCNLNVNQCKLTKLIKKIRSLETQCDKGYYLNKGQCYECYENCLDCNGIKCTECEMSYYPNEMNCYKCYEKCLDCDGIKCNRCIQGYYPNNMDCFKCYPNCIECDGIKCNKCIKGYYPKNMDCYKCHENCLECDGVQCLSCNNSYIPFKMDCLSGNKLSCNYEEGYYMLKKDFLELIENPEYMFICLSKEILGNGYFINSTKVNDIIYYFWEKCSNNCLECVGIEENNCSKCDGENYFKLYEDKLYENNFKCYEKNEKINYFVYEEDSIKYLRKCSNNCLTCINNLNNKCTSCDNLNFFFKYDDIPNISDGAQCFNQIELPNYYLYMNQYFKECIGVCSTNDCDSSCINCLIEDKYECLSCNFQEDYYPLSIEYNETKGHFKCFLKSNYPHYFINETDKSLVECSNTCETCIKFPNYCLKCSEGAYYIQGMNDFKCHFSPPGINYVLNNETKEWQKCNERCKTCYKQTNSELDQQCTSCNNSGNYFAYQKDVDAWNQGKNKYKLTGFNCFSKNEVFENYFLSPINKTWTKCSKNCSKCEINQDNCTECNNENEYYNIKNHKNGSCFKNPLPGYILDSEKEFNTCFRTCKYCHSTSNSFLYMQCSECDEKLFTLANNSYEKSYCVPKDNSSSYYLNEQLKWYIEDYNNSEHYKIYDYEVFNNKKYENIDFVLTYKCPKHKSYIISSIRQCVSNCSNPNDLVEYGLFFNNKPLYVYNGICYDECPYGSIPDNKSMTCVEKNKYIFEKLIIKKEFYEYYQRNVDIYLGKSANNTIFQIQSFEFTNFFYNSSTNDSWKYEQNMPIFDFNECISLLCKKNNYSKDEIHIGIFQNNDLKKEIPNTILLSAINSTSYKIFLSNGTIIDFSICNGMKISVKKPINISMIENFEIGLQLLTNYNLSIFDTENDAFNDICIPLELNGKDLSIFTRQNNLKSKMKLCDDGCNFLGIDYERNYSLCECKIKDEDNSKMGFGDFVKDNIDIVNQTLNLKEKSNLIIFKCLFKTKFDSKNYIFYLSLFFILFHFFSLFFYFKVFCKKIKIRNENLETSNNIRESQNRKSLYNTKKKIFENVNRKNGLKELINNKNKKINISHNLELSKNIIESNEIFLFKNKKKNALSSSVPILPSKDTIYNNNKNNEEKFCTNFINILNKNFLDKIPLEKNLRFETIIILAQIIIFLLQSFLFWNGLLNTEEYITKRFDEKNKIGFLYILTNEFNKYIFTSIFVLISIKLIRLFFDGIKHNKSELIENKISIEKYIFLKKFNIISIEVIISIFHIFFSIFLYIFGNIYPNNKNLLLISACISLIFNFVIKIFIIFISSLIMLVPVICKCLSIYKNFFEEIGNYLLNLI